MHDSEGDLLIGGMRLSHLQCELELEIQNGHRHDWQFTGRIRLSPDEHEQLELGRLYRLQLADGRGGQVVIARLEVLDNEHVVAEFVPLEHAQLQSLEAE